VAPGLTQRLAALADRLLPAESDRQVTAGHTVEDEQPGWFRAATRLTRAAATRFHQHRDVV
jgi:hypothetical protein